MELLALIIHTHVRAVRPFICTYIYDRACVRTCIYMCMHLYPREFAFVYTQKRKRSFLREFACVCVFTRALIKTQNAFACKIFQHSNTGFRNFQDVLYRSTVITEYAKRIARSLRPKVITLRRSLKC